MTNANPGHIQWTTSGSGFFTVVLPQYVVTHLKIRSNTCTSCFPCRAGAQDENNLPPTWSAAAYDNYTSSVSMSGINAYTGSTHTTNGVYAFRGEIDELRPGTTTLVLRSPDTAATNTDIFSGVIMYRFVNTLAETTADMFNGGTLNSEQIEAALGSLTVGSMITISNTLMPGDTAVLPITEEFARIGYAIRGLRYEVTLTQTMASGSTANNLADARFGWFDALNVPSGYNTVVGRELSYDTSTGTAKSEYQVTDGSTTQSFFYDYSAQWGSWNGSITYTPNTIAREWSYPIDRISSSGDGSLSITVPKPLDVVTTGSSPAQLVTWSGQRSPFWTLSVRLMSVTKYPMLGEESDVTLKNYDAEQDNGHSLASIGSQMPFKLYMARISTPYWWRAMPVFSQVRNLNKVQDGAENDACMPRVDFQVINRFGSESPNGWSPSGSASDWVTFRGASVGSLTSGVQAERFYPNAAFIAGVSSDMQRQTPALVNTKWYTASLNAPASDLNTNTFALGANDQTSDDMWLMVRVSAGRRTLLTSSNAGVAAACGSNNIQIGSMGMLVDSIVDQCTSYADCLKEGGDNPNKGQKDDSANKDPSRFSNCYLKRAVGPNNVAIPQSKCMECNTDEHCGSGQYCHMDDGICGSSTFYSCGSDSGELFGMCREKSSDVLGKRCRHSSQSDGGGFTTTGLVQGAAASFNGFDSSPNSVPTFANGYGPSTYKYMSFDRDLVRKGDADDKGVAKGAFGACGEYVFYEAAAPGSSPNTPLRSDARGALWEGFCTADQKCVECVPGEGNGNRNNGVTCLNGKTFSAMDVDGTVRTFAENTAAGSILGTTSMIVVLVFLFAFYMYAEARRHRQAHGLPDLSCCECLLCCGACSKPAVATKKTSNPVAA